MHRLCVLTVLAGTIALTACAKKYEALPETACPEVVARSKSLLGEGVKDKTDEEMLAVCKASSPKQRGCAMAATVAADIMKCPLVK